MRTKLLDTTIHSSNVITGYIGGDALYHITQAHPEYEFTALVRNADKGAKVAQQYSKVKLVYGDLDSVDLIQEEAKKADVVLSTLHPHFGVFTC